MSTNKRYGIMVGIDGSPAANAAVCWAARDAALRRVPLTLVHMMHFMSTWPEMALLAGMSAWREDDGRQALEQATKLARDVGKAHNEIEVKDKLIWSPPEPMLIELSDEAEMVVVGSHGRSALSRGLLGSVSSGVVRRAKCPVAVIHDQDPSATASAGGDKAPIVLGVDGSPASELATAIAFDEASRRCVALKAVHVWSDVQAIELPGFDWTVFREQATEILAERLAGWQERYPDVAVHRSVVCDRPARRLIQEAASAQLLVVGSHGRGGLGRMMLGSVSNAVVNSVDAPVIVARRKD